jgi:hypothetical protein
MADGTLKSIENVKVGDQVRNAKPGDSSGATETHTVTQLHVTDADKDYVDLTVTTKAGASQIVRVTGHHLFYSASRHSWEYAGELEAGERLQTGDGQAATVSSSRIFRAVLRTFNLTVDVVHTYLVAVAGAAVLVHNCGGIPSSALDKMGDDTLFHYTNDEGLAGIMKADGSASLRADARGTSKFVSSR